MAEQVFEVLKFHAGFDQVSGECVSQTMRGDLLPDVRLTRMGPDSFVDRAATQPPAIATSEESSAVFYGTSN